MKQIYLVLTLLFSVYSFSQTTTIPDDNFEQALINFGYDDVLDNTVLTSNISDVLNIQLEDLDIADLTGIEDFTALERLDLSRNFLVSLDVSQNSNLELLDIAQMPTLLELNMQNGNNMNLLLGGSGCPNLACIQVDDIAFFNANINTRFFLNGTSNYSLSLDCSSLSVDDVTTTKKGTLYPNPSGDFIYILGINQVERYTIHNTLGAVVKSGFTSNDTKIDIRNLTTGLYFVRFNKGTSIKFIKE